MENQQIPTLLSLCFHGGWVHQQIILDIPSNSIFPISAKPFFIPVRKYELCSSHTQKGYKNCCRCLWDPRAGNFYFEFSGEIEKNWICTQCKTLQFEEKN
jgi:hypothetical protein